MDTSVLLEDPNALYQFQDNEIIIPIVVLEELDGKKRLENQLGRNARQVSRELDKLRERGDLQTGVTLEGGGCIKVEINHKHLTAVKEYFPQVTNDNRILAVAFNLMEERKNQEDAEKVILVSKDILVRVKAHALGIIAQDYMAGRMVPKREYYQGYITLEVPSSLINDIYSHGKINLPEEYFELYDFYPHEFIILKDQEGGSQSAVTYYEYDTMALRLMPFPTQDVWGIHPRNLQQKMAIELLLNEDIPLVTLTGKAGTGKTLLALAAGLYKTEDLNVYKKLLVAKPIVPMGKDIGYLPGDKDQKLKPWIQPIYDNLEYIFGDYKGGAGDILVGLRKIAIEPLTFIRGRSIPQQFIIIDEAQNLTKHEIKTIISRVGEGSKVVLIGDPEQIDNPYLDSCNNGLTYVVEKLKEYPEAGHVTFTKGERSRLAQLAADVL